MIFFATLTGCATSPVPLDQTQEVPGERTYLKGEDKREGNARVTFVRDKGFSGSGVYQHVYVNGVKSFSLNPGERASLNLKPGEYSFSVVPTNPFGTHVANAIDQDLKADRVYVYRIMINGATLTTSIVRVISDPR